MKKRIFSIILAVLLSPAVAVAAPFLYGAPTTSPWTSCNITIDGTVHTVIPYDRGDGTTQAVLDLGALNLASGNHNAIFQYLNTLWGVQSNAVPFDFPSVAQGDMEDPSGIGLAAKDPRQ